MRRKPGALLPLEVDILTTAIDLRRRGQGDFHGFLLAKELADRAGAKQLTGHGTLYKALGRLADAGLLERRWEAADAAAQEGRPRRRLYEITGAGERALAAWQQGQGAASARRLGLEPT